MSYPLPPPIYQSGNVSGQSHLDWLMEHVTHTLKAFHWWVANVYVQGDGVIAYGPSLPATTSLKAKQTTVASMKVQVLEGQAVIDGAIFFQDGTFTSIDLVAPVSNDRIDLVYADVASQEIRIAPGVESATPSAPATPSGAIALAEICHRPAETSIKDADDAVNGYITDVRTYCNQ